MHRLPLAPLTALALVLSTAAASAAPSAKSAAGGRAVEWFDVRDLASAHAGVAGTRLEPRAAAERFLQSAAADLRLEGVDLAVKSDLQAGTARTVRFTQTYHGLPVIGGAVAVRLGADGAPRAAVLDVARGLSVATTPALDEGAARSAVEESIGMSLLSPPSFHLAVQPEAEGSGKLVWMVDIHRGTRNSTRFLVDAHDGSIVFVRRTALDAMGRVYSLNAVDTPTPVDVQLNDLVAGTPQYLTGWDGNLTVTNYVSGAQQGGYTVEQTLTPNAGEDFLFDPPADPLDGTDGFAQVNVYYHMTRIRDYFQQTHGVDTSPASWKVTAVANLMENGQPFDNAFFAPETEGVLSGPLSSPNMMGIYQGTMTDFSGDSDVFLHEFGHYISHNAVGYNGGQFGSSEYGISPWGGGIDEGIADYFACTLNGNAILGEATLAPLGAARDLEDTAKVCPSGVVGEVHEDGEIIGSVGWSIRTALGAEVADRLVWGSVQTLMPGSSLGDFGRGLVQTAEDLVAAGEIDASAVTTVEAILAARGLDDCDHVLQVRPNEERVTNQIGLGALAAGFGASCAQVAQLGISLHSFFHFQAEVQPGDEALRFKVDLTPVEGGALQWSIYARAGEHVGMGPIPLPIPGLTLFEPQEFDFRVEGITETEGELVIDKATDPEFAPGRQYFFVLKNQNCPTTVARMSVSNEPAEGAGGAGGGGGAGGAGGAGGEEPSTPSDSDEDSGCSCSMPGDDASSGSPWGALLGLGLATALLRRRNARTSSR
ncbi:MYXO-CTERM sorting domain-containing protein [Chondromyces apiculatus]|uniref:FTP domain-containing protein n=1 Tax=Chondromyces apiculatus DSM 436 TaxID=1192034 RepID=A0A017T7A2_9BACT|nr:MYXO-CTERM sorting domain-containing protein [Chondromyces apiculatus]EYF04680.1 Hypothetical protein CAP_4356 [Chondromyces apiculatus DSM 436]